jgi:plastocyanin
METGNGLSRILDGKETTMGHLRRSLVVIPIAALLAAGALSSLAAAEPAGRAVLEPRGAAKIVRVRALDDVFRPSAVTISRGTRVRWVNRGDDDHTTTGSTWSVTLSPGERFTKLFRQAGTYRYSCTLHSGMTGRVVVT